jgi:hypothetical protein
MRARPRHPALLDQVGKGLFHQSLQLPPFLSRDGAHLVQKLAVDLCRKLLPPMGHLNISLVQRTVG